MISTKLLLKDKLYKLPKNQQKNFLINCINKHYDFSEIQYHDSIEKDKNLSLCKICNSSDFYFNKHEEICQNCGLTRPFQQQLKNFEKIEYIKPGANIVKIEKNGKTVSVDLNKINLWLQETDPYAKEIKLIEETLNIVFDQKGLVLNQNIINSAISLYLNFNSLLDKIDSAIKPQFNKKAIIALCIYYAANINSINISLQQLSILFNTSIPTLYSNNNVIKQIFENTEYIKYFNLSSKHECNIDLSLKNKLLLNKIIIHLKDNFPDMKESIDNRYYAAIIYYITNNINKVRKYTLNELSNICKVSEPSISSAAKNIIRFYQSNPSLFKELI